MPGVWEGEGKRRMGMTVKGQHEGDLCGDGIVLHCICVGSPE